MTGAAMTASAARLAEVFVEVSDAPTGEIELSNFLQMVTVRAAEVVRSDAAGLLLADPQDRLRVVAGSNEGTEVLELFQVQHQEGPCLECFRAGAPVVNADLAGAAGRWPQFAPRAVAAGFRSVHAIPLQLRHATVGALNLFDSHTGRLQPDDIRIVQALADVATIRMLQARAVRGGKVLTDQLQADLDARIVIEQAKGAVASVHRISVDRAAELMVEYSRRHRRRLRDVAQALVDDPASISGLGS